MIVNERRKNVQKQLSFDDFRAVYAPIIEASGTTDIAKALKEAREVYDLLEGGSELAKSDINIEADSDYKNLSISDLIYHSDSIMTSDGEL